MTIDELLEENLKFIELIDPRFGAILRRYQPKAQLVVPHDRSCRQVDPDLEAGFCEACRQRARRDVPWQLGGLAALISNVLNLDPTMVQDKLVDVLEEMEAEAKRLRSMGRA